MKEMYKGIVNSPETTIMNDISNSDTTLYVLDGSIVPDSLPNLLVIGTGRTAETVKVTTVVGDVLTVVRAFQGVARAWPLGTVVARNFTDYDYGALIDNIEEVTYTVGNKTELTTTTGVNLVSAINEIDAKEAIDIAYDPSSVDILSTNVQAGISEVAAIATTLKSDLASTSIGKGASAVRLQASGKPFAGNNVESALRELFTSVSDGKNVIATAISDRGISTGGSATFPQMAANINAITGEDRFERIMDVQRIRTASLSIDLSTVIHAREEIIYVVLDDTVHEMDLNSLQLSGRACNCGSTVTSMSSDELYLYVGLLDGRVLSIKPGPFTIWDQRTLFDAVVTVHAANGLVYAGAGSMFYILNRSGLTIKQSSGHSGTVSLITASDEFVYMIADVNYLFKKNALTGETVDYQQLTDLRIVTDLMWLDDALYMAAVNGAWTVFYVSRYTSELVRTHHRSNLGDVAFLATEGDYVYTFSFELMGTSEFTVYRLNKLDLSTESTTNMTQTPNDFEMKAVSYTKGFLTILGPRKKVHKVMVKGYRPK